MFLQVIIFTFDSALATIITVTFTENIKRKKRIWPEILLKEELLH